MAGRAVMSMGEMQACLARLYVDESFRRLCALDPSALREYRLTPDEERALRTLDPEKLENFARSLRNKRRRRAERAYPLLFLLDAGEMARYYARYYQLNTARPHGPLDRDLIDFGTFIEDSLVDRPAWLPSYARDLARYERLCNQAEFDVSAYLRVAAGEPVNTTGPPLSLDARPALSAGVEVAEFDSDMADIERRLLNGEAPDSLIPVASPACLVFRRPTALDGARFLRVNTPTKAVLDLCTGERPVSAIVAGVEARLDANGLTAGVVKTIERLLALEVLTLDPRGEAWLHADRYRGDGTAQTEGI